MPGGDGKDCGMDSLEELITRELKEAFDEFDKVPGIQDKSVASSIQSSECPIGLLQLPCF